MLMNWIKTEEGFSKTVYNDILGVPTFGYGFTSLEEDEAELVLELKLSKLRKRIVSYLHNNEISLDSFRKDVLTDMAYNLGFDGITKFRKMFEALKDMDYDRASKEMLDSQWFKQVPNRCSLLAQRMKNGY